MCEREPAGFPFACKQTTFEDFWKSSKVQQAVKKWLRPLFDCLHKSRGNAAAFVLRK